MSNAIEKLDLRLRESGRRVSESIRTKHEYMMSKNPLTKALKFDPIEVSDQLGEIRARYTVGPEHTNYTGAIHGGVVASILDDVAGMAAVALVGEGFRGTIGMSVSFLEKTRPGTYLSQARIVGCNKSVLFAEASIVAEDGAVLATSTGQYAYTLLGA